MSEMLKALKGLSHQCPWCGTPVKIKRTIKKSNVVVGRFVAGVFFLLLAFFEYVFYQASRPEINVLRHKISLWMPIPTSLHQFTLIQTQIAIIFLAVLTTLLAVLGVFVFTKHL